MLSRTPWQLWTWTCSDCSSWIHRVRVWLVCRTFPSRLKPWCRCRLWEAGVAFGRDSLLQEIFRCISRRLAPAIHARIVSCTTVLESPDNLIRLRIPIIAPRRWTPCRLSLTWTLLGVFIANISPPFTLVLSQWKSSISRTLDSLLLSRSCLSLYRRCPEVFRQELRLLPWSTGRQRFFCKRLQPQ